MDVWSIRMLAELFEVNTNSILHQIKQYGKDEIADGRPTIFSKYQIESLLTILTGLLSTGERPAFNDIHH